MAEVRGWFGRDAPALSEAACERLAALVQRLATPRHLLQPTPAYAAYASRGWPTDPEPIPDDMLWDAKAVSNAVRLLRDIVPKLRAWEAMLATPETRADLAAVERLDQALADALPHLERAWGRCLPDHRKQPPAWERAALVIAGAFETALRQAGKKPGRGPTTIVWKAVWRALTRLDCELPLQLPTAVTTVFEHIDRMRDKAGELSKRTCARWTRPSPPRCGGG